MLRYLDADIETLLDAGSFLFNCRLVMIVRIYCGLWIALGRRAFPSMIVSTQYISEIRGGFLNHDLILAKEPVSHFDMPSKESAIDIMLSRE